MKWATATAMSNSVKGYCVKEKKRCVVGWIDKYFKDCLCNRYDEISFVFGMISLVCWGVAEIPQIITNFRTKSSHGVSLLFLLTWIAGDVFNLVGCLLEPATLPTQYYTALLYTISTLVLVFQAVYYDHFYRWWKCGRIQAKQKDQGDKEERKHLILKPDDDDSTKSVAAVPTTPLKVSSRRDFYFTSARSMAGSSTPPFRSYLRPVKSGPSAMRLDTDSSSEDETSDPQVASNKWVSQPKAIPRSAGYGAFLATSVNLPWKSKALMEAYVGLTARKLLHENGSSEENVYGQWMGWLMAGIYMGGRIPQIWLNIKRGSVEGLNPLMFVFALIANVTYVASILVRTTEWDKIKANMPWLLDAIVCVVLDLFIIWQYIYYKYLHKRSSSDGDGDYEEYTDRK